MIAISGRKTIDALQQKNSQLETQLEVLSSQLSATTEHLGMISDQLAMAISRLECQAQELSSAKLRIGALADMAADQAAEIMRLDEREERRAELDRRLQADMARLERQATMDVTEFRETSLVLAQRLLGRRQDAGAQSVVRE